MNCSSWRREISAWFDGALPSDRKEKVRLHIARCPECARVYAELGRVSEVFESARKMELEPPPFMWQKVQVRLREQERARFSSRGRRGLLAWFGVPSLRYALGASVLLLVTGVVAIRTRAPLPVDPDSLSQLDSYTLEVVGNPFLAQSDEQNPFFGLGQQEPGNPFDLGGVTQ